MKRKFNYSRTKGKIYFSSNYGGRKTIWADWRYPDLFAPTTKTRAARKERIRTKKFEFDDFELIDIYQSLLARSAIGELTENDDESSAKEKVKQALSKEQVKY